MKGSVKQIAWAEDIKASAILAAGCIVRNAENGCYHDIRFISVEVAKELEQMVVSGFATMNDAAQIISIRDRFTQSNLENMARCETKRRAQC